MSSFTPSQSSFTVGEIKPVHAGNLLALAAVRFGPLTISGWRIIQQPGQRAYVSAPQAQYVDKSTGRTAYAPLIKVDDPVLTDQLRAAILRAWERITLNSPAYVFDDEEVA